MPSRYTLEPIVRLEIGRVARAKKAIVREKVPLHSSRLFPLMDSQAYFAGRGVDRVSSGQVLLRLAIAAVRCLSPK